MNTYAIYLRKSRADVEAEQHGEGETLARHKTALLALAHKMGVTIAEIYKEVVSGETIASRPEIRRLLSDVSAGKWAGILVMDIDRLARGDTMDQGLVAQTFKYSDTKIITPGKTYDPSNEFDEEYFEFGLFMSRREYKTINRRLQRGRYASAKEGKFVGSIAPFGYEKVKVKDDKGYTLKIVPEKAEIVRLVFSMYVDGEDGRRLGIQQIARRLNEMKIPPIRHDYWQKETIRDMLINPTYAGKIRWGWRPERKKMVAGQKKIERPRNTVDCVLVKGLHEAIVDAQTFDRAQDYMESCPPAPVGYKSELKNPLAGLIICGKCGRKMTLRKGYGKPDYIVCHCRACDNVSAPYPLVEAKVMGALKQWLAEYKAQYADRSVSHSSNDILQKSLSKLDKDISVLSKQLSATYDLLEQGIYTTEQFLDRSRSLSERIDVAQKDRRALEDRLGLSAAQDETRRTIIPRVEHVLSVYNKLPSADQKNELLKGVLEKVVYTKSVSGNFRGVSANDFSIQLYPRLPSSTSNAT